MKKENKKEFDLFHINNKNIINIKFNETKKEYKIERFLLTILETVGGIEYYTNIFEDIKNFKLLIKLPFEQKTLIFVFKHLRSNGYPILLTDLFNEKDFMKLKILMRKTNKILRNSIIPISYYRNLIKRIKDYLLERNIKLKEYSIDELINKISYKSKPVVLILNLFINKIISITLFKYWNLDIFCSFDMYRLTMNKLFKN